MGLANKKALQEGFFIKIVEKGPINLQIFQVSECLAVPLLPEFSS
jgi:hypothetical protein